MTLTREGGHECPSAPASMDVSIHPHLSGQVTWPGSTAVTILSAHVLTVRPADNLTPTSPTSADGRIALERHRSVEEPAPAAPPTADEVYKELQATRSRCWANTNRLGHYYAESSSSPALAKTPPYPRAGAHDECIWRG